MSAGRVAVVLWASPMTAAGMLGAALAGRRPRRVGDVLLVTSARGPFGAMLRRRRMAGAALGHVVITSREPSPALLAHELAHVRQAEWLGPLFPLVYLVLLAARGYRNHPLERAARRAALPGRPSPGGRVGVRRLPARRAVARSRRAVARSRRAVARS